MNLQELKAALAPSRGTLTLDRSSLGSVLAGFLDAHYQGLPLVISDAAPGPGDGTGDTVVLTGRGTLLGVTDLPLTARFSLDDEGKVRALLHYRLRETMPGPAAWTFSRSFPKLPTVWNFEKGFPANNPSADFNALQKPYVDALELFDMYYAVSTHAQPDPELGVPLEPGVNVLGRMRPRGMAGVLESALRAAQPLTLHGPVQLPRTTDLTTGLTRWQRAWDRPDAPGIHLRALLDLDFKVGNLVFENAALRIYTPPSTDWQSQNPSFRPAQGYTGRLSIPSAGISLDLSSELTWGMPGAFLHARCEGVALGKLTQLVDLAGTDALSSAMPSELKSAVDALEKLELIDLGVSLATGGSSPVVDAVMVTVGMPTLSWQVWDDHLKVENIKCRFRISNPFGGGPSTVGVTLMGTVTIEGVPVSITAERDGGFVLSAKLEGQPLPLDALMKTYVPGVPAPAPLTVTRLGLTVSPGRFYSMSTVLAGQPNPWVLPVGRSDLTLGNVAFDFKYPKGGPVQGTFAATASLGKSLTLAVRYGIPGNLTLRGSFHDIKLRGLVDELCDAADVLPPDFDLTFSTASVLVEKRGDDYVLQLAAALEKVGVFAFETGKVGGKWGFTAGMDLAASLSNLPGLSALKPVEDFVQLRKLMLLISTHDNPRFQFPDLARFQAPQLPARNLALPAQSTGVTRGLMAFAEWQLDPNEKQQGLLGKLLGLGGTQRVTVAVGQNPAKDARLFFSQQSKINGLPFNYQLGVLLQNGKPSFFLAGSLTAKIQGQPQTFDLTTLFVPTGAFLSATMKGATAVDCGPFMLSNLAMQIGVNWSGIPSLGIAATIDTKAFSSSVAVFFDSTDPTRSLVAGSLGTLSARDVLDAFAGGLKTELDEVLEGIAIKGTHEFTLPGELGTRLDGLEYDQVSAAFAGAKYSLPATSQGLTIVPKSKGSSWHLTDMTTMRHYELDKRGDKIRARISPQFYFAPQPTAIGTIRFPQAFDVSAAISFAGFNAEATVDISPNKGLCFEGRMDKIVLLDEKLFSIQALQGNGGPELSLSTFAQPTNPVPERRSPHFHLNGKLTMLGVDRGIHASVTRHGVDFELVGKLAKGVTFDIAARFGKAGLAASGDLQVGVGTLDLGPLGKAKLDTELDVEVDIAIETRTRDASAPLNTSWPTGVTVLANDRARLDFQSDGNLVLHKSDGAGWERAWSANTGGKGGNKLILQSDGNLVITTASGAALWATGTNGQNVSKLVLRADGNLVVEGSGRTKWQSNTSRGEPDAYVELESEFTFAGQHVKIGKFRLAAESDLFPRLPSIIAKKAEEALRDLYKDAAKWADAVKDGLLEGANDTAKVLEDVYGKSEEEAKELAKTVGKGASSATKTVENTARNAARSAEKKTKKALKKVKFW